MANTEEQPGHSEPDTIEQIEQVVKDMQRYKTEHILQTHMVTSVEYLQRQDEILLDLVQYIKNENLKTKRVVHNNAVLLSSLAIITVFSGTTIGVLIGLVLHFSHRPVNCSQTSVPHASRLLDSSQSQKIP